MYIGLSEVLGTNSVIPTKSGEKAFTPRAGMTLFIALLLSMAAIILLQQAKFFILQFLMLLFKSVPGFV